MADGQFTSVVSKDRNANALTNPIYTQLSDGAAALGVTAGALDVNVASGSVTVTATNLDIRDLVHTQDNVGLGDGTVLLDLVVLNSAYSGTANVMPVAGRYQATPDTYGDGDATAILTDANGKIVISNPGGTEYVEDVAAAQPATGNTFLVERDDVLAGITPIEGDWTKLYANANGALWVKHDGDITIADGGNSITVDGTVAVSSVGGTVAVTQSGVWNIGTVASITADVNIADGGNSITVDAVALDIRTITKATDSIQISKDTAVNSETNPIYVYQTNSVVSGNEVHDYDVAVAVASDATANHDYTVTGGTFLLKEVIISGSGNVKAEIQVGPLASLATKAVVFLTGRQGDTKVVEFNPPIEVPVTGTGTVRIIKTNRQGAATDLYSTIIGSDV